MKPIQKGDTVTIYEDPFTQTKREGDAVVVRVVDRNACGGDCTLVRVRFPRESETYDRYIKN